MYRPLVAIAGGFVLGIIASSRFGLVAFLLPLLLGLIYLGWPQRPRMLLLALIATLCGLLWLQWRTPVWPQGYAACQAEMRVIAVEATANSSQLTVRVESLAGQRLPRWNTVKARLILTPEHTLTVGDGLNGVVNWQPASSASNPGEFDYAAYLRRQGVLAQAFINDLEEFTISRPAAGRWNLRQRLLTRAARLDGAGGELLGTLTLGGRSGPWAESWRQTGLAHVLSISGLHIGLVLLSLLGLGRLLRLPPHLANLIAAGCLLAYGFILGPRPAVWRAIIMALVGILAVANNRLRDWPSAVSLAVIILLIYNPYYLWDAGWQLSFAATVGILYLAPQIRERLPLLPWKLDWTVSASLAAQLATLPLLLQHFYLFTPLSLLFNILLTPWLPVALVGGLLYLLLPGIGDLLLPCLQLLYGAMLRLVDWFAAWPLASFSAGAPPILLLLAYCILLLAFFRLRDRWRPLLAAALVGVCCLLLVWQPLERFVSNTYYFCMLSVGQGSASVLHLPGGDALLFDVGGGHSAIGNQVIVPYLRYRGTWRVSAVYLSHLHTDHILGLSDVLDAFPVTSVYVPATSRDDPGYAELSVLLADKQVELLHWVRGDSRLHSGVLVSAINPPPGNGSDENEDSLVLQLNWPNLSLLAPGDIGTRELELLPYLSTQLDVLIVPHHGSAHSSNEEFLRLLQPQHAVISTGRNLYGHPAAAVLERLDRYSQHIWRTDHHGAITIRNSHRGWSVAPYLTP